MRTGRPMATESISQPQAVDAQAQRRERIEALRQERMEQLRALREKRAGAPTLSAGRSPARSAATSPSGISQNHPNLPPFPVQARSQANPSGFNQRMAQLGQQAGQRRTSVPTPQQGRGQAQNRARRPQVIATSAPAPQSRRRSTNPKSTPARSGSVQPRDRQGGRIEELSEFNPSNTPKRSAQQTVQSARSMLRSRSSIRQAMILREVLDRPIALRDQDIASGSLLS